MDKRVLKTKKHLKDAMLQLMAKKEFTKITVTEICETADISRITFYMHYDNKYSLLEDFFLDLEKDVLTLLGHLQEKNNPQDNISIGFQNLMDAIVDVTHPHLDVSTHLLDNTDIIPYFYRFVISIMSEYEQTHNFTTKYPVDHLNAFFALGLWAFLRIDDKAYPDEHLEQETVRNYAHTLIKDLAKSDIIR